jgi:hypothetical protein
MNYLQQIIYDYEMRLHEKKSILCRKYREYGYTRLEEYQISSDVAAAEQNCIAELIHKNFAIVANNLICDLLDDGELIRYAKFVIPSWYWGSDAPTSSENEFTPADADEMLAHLGNERYAYSSAAINGIEYELKFDELQKKFADGIKRCCGSYKHLKNKANEDLVKNRDRVEYLSLSRSYLVWAIICEIHRSICNHAMLTHGMKLIQNFSWGYVTDDVKKYLTFGSGILLEYHANHKKIVAALQ